MKSRKALVIGVVAGMLLILQAAVAQDQPPQTDANVAQGQQDQPPQAQDQDQAPAQDPPGRVARLNYSNGSVSMQPGGEGDWVDAVANRPLTTGDNLWADKDSRAELHIGSTAIRMDSETSLTFLDLDDQTTQLKLSMGSVILRVRHLDDGDTFEVDTPNLAYSIQRTGEYRIDVNADGNETDTTVWQGRAEATGGGASFVVVGGQHARFSGTDQLDHEIDQVPGSDDFDNFAFSRDQQEDRAESANYISTEMTGYEDLDSYGHWGYAADYGPVWTPDGLAAGWAPYRFGHWVWIEPWGWTWVEDEPWGFAPFHYGRWAFVESSWCWVPGPVYVRPVYAPALVAFVGGGGFHLSAGVGVGWFPLGPREVFVPWYRTSRVYVNNVNITNTRVNVVQVTNFYNTYRAGGSVRITYANQRVTNGVTVVSHDTFVNARPVERNIERVDARQLADARVAYRPEVQPARASVMGAGASARFRPPAAVVNRQVIATRNPTPPRASFEQRQSAMNVRTEAPATAPQSAARAPEVSQRTMAAPPVEQPRNVPQAEGNFQRTVARPSQPGPQSSMVQSHPLVRSAPPVQERPEMQRSEQQKFSAWQQQRQRSAPPAQERRAPAPQHEERRK